MIKLKKLLKEDENLGKSLAWIQTNMNNIYDAIDKVEKATKENKVAVKDSKLKSIMKQLKKFTADYAEAVNNLDVPDYNRGYDKKRFKRPKL